MSDQNPTQKGQAPNDAVEIPIPEARCPHCGRVIPGMNILTMELPTPKGNMIWLLPSCPFIAGPDEKAVDGGEPCGRIIGTLFVGYGPPTIATPGGIGWS